ncbi:glycine C-acetyltransferase [Mesorhizobium sp. M0482]|uniref:glycine C-acetyltransferase n=1 Tax=Mesorhizobium sp. M0482 TaxID=2956948 RepID=UPI00333D36C4
MTANFISHLSMELESLKKAGLYKSERVITSTQSSDIELADGRKVLNFCANNYLGLADSRELREAAKQALDRYGYGMASVRFICGTQVEHKQLEATISRFLSTEDTILYSSCFDANGGLFETLLDEQDAIISDALNHASIIDGVRLSKAKRFRYANNDMADLEARLQEAKDSRFRLIVTDGVFSMDGIIANLKGICDLAEKYGAMVMVDDSHAVGFVGKHGRGSAEYCGVEGRVDIITGTLGKAAGRGFRRIYIGQARGGGLAASALPALSLFQHPHAGDCCRFDPSIRAYRTRGELRERLYANADRFRTKISKAGFTLAGANHPIIPVMLGDASLAQHMAEKLLQRGIYVVGFSFPVVPKGQARIRTQMSAAHSSADVDRAVEAFTEVGKELGAI